MTDVTIRTAVSGDIHAILRIAEHGWNEAYDECLSQETIDSAMTEWYDPDTTREQIEHEDVPYLVAEKNGRILGYTSGRPSGEETIATLGAIYVDPEYWGNGIGTALLEAFEDCCHHRGYDTIQFHVLAENDVGTSFYQKHGYDVIDEQEADLFGETVHEYVFRGQVE